MKFLIVGPSWVGDMVMAQSLFKHLKARYGDGTIIDVIAPAWSLPVLERMPEVRRGIALDVKHGEFGWKIRKALGLSLRAEKYDRAIVMPTTWKSALVPFFAKIPVRTGFTGEMRFGLINDRRSRKRAGEKTAIRYVSLGMEKNEPLPELSAVPFPRLEPRSAEGALKRLGLTLDKPVVALFPGAEYGPAKQWPIEHYAQLAAMLEGAGKYVWVFGSAKEQKLGDRIAVDTNAVNLCGQTTLAEAIDLIALAESAVTNDSGLMHVAAALEVPLVAIYGSSSPERTPPLSRKAAFMQGSLECSPCYKKVCPFGHTNCLNIIRPIQILKSLQNTQQGT